MIATFCVVRCVNTAGIGLGNGSSSVNIYNFSVCVGPGEISDNFADSGYKCYFEWRNFTDYQDQWMVSLRKLFAQ